VEGRTEDHPLVADLRGAQVAPTESGGSRKIRRIGRSTHAAEGRHPAATDGEAQDLDPVAIRGDELGAPVRVEVGHGDRQVAAPRERHRARDEGVGGAKGQAPHVAPQLDVEADPPIHRAEAEGPRAQVVAEAAAGRVPDRAPDFEEVAEGDELDDGPDLVAVGVGGDLEGPLDAGLPQHVDAPPARLLAEAGHGGLDDARDEPLGIGGALREGDADRQAEIPSGMALERPRRLVSERRGQGLDAALPLVGGPRLGDGDRGCEQGGQRDRPHGLASSGGLASSTPPPSCSITKLPVSSSSGRLARSTGAVPSRNTSSSAPSCPS
jgi:hypothetical protein